MKNARTIAKEMRAEARRLDAQAMLLRRVAATLAPRAARTRGRAVAPEKLIGQAAEREAAERHERVVAAPRERVSLRVISQTAPTATELKDREVRHVTQEG